ncbi:TetR family transcriptional regulator [Corynebacterium alimapuense]|uniref:TetR family transcriptional regulator n=1 Tax=Corynebacterium alimapuense TaxID=1576874 RepID=UPI0014041CF8|nr:TetR family transcriptional regulator [Corynebacterium alimapuense]
MQLTREAIVTAALDILDAYGLNDMTMRRVSSHLGVAPGALYWHLPNKQQLISAIADEILSPALAHSEYSAPEDLSGRLRQAMLAHRDGAELVAAALSQPDSATRSNVEKQLAESLSLVSTDDDLRRVGACALLHLVLGASAQEQAQIQYARDTGTEIAGLESAGDDFRQSIDLIVFGLERRSTSQVYRPSTHYDQTT